MPSLGACGAAHEVVQSGTRKLAAGSAIEYIKALASGPDMASRLINFGYDAQSKLISAASPLRSSKARSASATKSVIPDPQKNARYGGLVPCLRNYLVIVQI